MFKEFALAFSALAPKRASDALRTLVLVPFLGESALRESDIGLRTAARAILIRLRLAPAAGAAPAERLAFWCARAGGVAHLLSIDPAARDVTAVQRTLEASDILERDIAPHEFAASVRRLFASALRAAPDLDPFAAGPVLRFTAGGAGWDGVRYDRSARTVFFPSVLAPPEGDEFPLEIAMSGGERVIGGVRVLAVRRAGEAAPGRPAGFLLGIAPASVALQLGLTRACVPPAVRDESRASHRYPIARRVRVTRVATGEETEGRLRDISVGGTFVRTGMPAARGTVVDVAMRLPIGEELVARATVVHANDEGMGLRFDVSSQEMEKLSAAVVAMSARPRRVLVVEDDALARRMLADAFKERGFEVLTAPDGIFGLRTLTDQLLTLDLLVTDLVMPGLDGERLIAAIREAGGEPDLPIVVVTAGDAGERQRLLSLGADEVLAKSLGAESIVEAALAALDLPRAPSVRPGDTGNRPDREEVAIAAAVRSAARALV
jgi:CheY-like chemotaxis protein